jgi:signal transduction histidine kinase
MSAQPADSLILNVDDNDGARYAKTRILTRAGLRVIEAASGGEALQMAQLHHPDLVLLDMKLPDIHGMEVCRQLKADSITQSILVLQTSASYLSSADKIRALEGGADNYLFEPIEPEELVANVKALLRLGKVERQLRESDRLKDEFLATLAHELRNPLGPIRNAVELLRHLGPEQQEQQEQARQTIMRQTNHLVRLVDDLLDVSRINKGKIVLQREPVALNGFIHTALETAGPIMESRRHQLTVSLPPNDVVINGDGVRLAQVVGNLLHNAAKFTQVGGEVSLCVETEGDMLAIRVRDNGIGIAPEQRKKIFELFAQAEHVPDRVQDGLGIGLSLVRKLVELHGGEVTAQSAGRGQGSTFEVRLPIMASMQQAMQDAPESEMPAGGGHRILVVDDSADSASMLCALLELNGHLVKTAANGKEAMAAVVAFRPDLVFLDIGLPDMSGYEVAARIRALKEAAGITLVALTGYGHEKDRQEAMAAGFDHHLVKPINFDALMALTAPKA